jgi:hypothetical protein
MAQDQSDPVVRFLIGSKELTDPQRAKLWSAYDLVKDEDDLTARLKALDVPDTVKAELWDLKSGGGTPEMKAATETREDAVPGNTGALAMRVASKAIPATADTAARFATSPTVPKTAAAVGRVVGGMAPVIGGASKAGLGGAMIGAAGAAQGAWAGGKTGWFTGKLLQNIALPIAEVLEKAKPYVQSLSTVSGAQGVLDLAQMADPKRVDIGVLGIAPSDTKASQQSAVMGAQIRALISQGVPSKDAVQRVSQAWAAFLRDQRKDGAK